MLLRILSPRPDNRQGAPFGSRAREVKPENVSLVDIMPTLLDLAGTSYPRMVFAVAACSLCCAEAPFRKQVVVAEYHAQGMLSAGYMAKKGNLKYNHYVGLPPQLFDLAADPDEFVNLADHPRLGRGPVRLASANCLPNWIPKEVDQKGQALTSMLEGMARSYAG